MELFRLFGTVLIDDKDAIQSLKNVDEKGKKTKTSLTDIANKGAKIGTVIVAGTGVAIGGLMAMANSTSETAAHWLELSQRTDISVESLQRWGYAASQSGANVDVLETGMKKLSTSMVNAQSGSEDAVNAYKALGISMSDLSKMTPEATFDAVMSKLADMPESAQKNVIGNQLLGKSYVELKPLLKSGSDGMQELKNKADELGIVMSEKSVVAAEGYGDSVDNLKASFDGIKNNLISSLMPQLTLLMDWFTSNMPSIQGFVINVFDKMGMTIKFIADNSNILIPILTGLAAVFVTMQIISVINGLMAAYTAFTTTATGVQIGLNAALLANPIALVVAAIGTLIAIGVALVLNWDKVKSGVKKLWTTIKTVFGGIKDSVTEKVDAIKSKVTSTFDNISTAVSSKVNGIKTTIGNVFGSAKDSAIQIFDNLKSGITGKVDAVKTKISNVFGTVKDIMTSPFESAKTKINGVIDKIKGFLNFQWNWPKLKMPHFSVSGSMNPMKWIDEGVPKISVDWYAKGGIFSKPTIFNTPYGLKGVGEAGAEVVAPLRDLKSMLGLDKKQSINLEMNLNIENFNNNTEQDLEELSNELAFLTKRKLEGGGLSELGNV